MSNNQAEMQKKTVFKLFFAWQDQQEERWLEEMAAQGWLLEKYTFLRYHFTAIEPAEYIYRLDYKTTPEKDMEEYKAIFEESGWEHVGSYLGWQYLRIPREQYTVDIYSDKASQIEKLRRMTMTVSGLLIPLFIMVVVLDINEIEAFERYNLGFMNVVFPFLYLIMVAGMIINLIWLVHLSNRIRELEKEEELPPEN